jgi:hypothetical protein
MGIYTNVKRLGLLRFAARLAFAACSAHAAVTTLPTLLVATATAKPGDTVMAGVRLKMAAGWHTYWRNPGGPGISTEIQWKLPPGATAGEIQWPTPEKFIQSIEEDNPASEKIINYAYSGEVVLLVPLKLAVGGGISKHRMALETLIHVLDELGPERISVLSSGILTDDFAKEVWIKHPCVRHVWLDTTRDYFRQLATCDLVYGVRADAEDSLYRSLVFPQKVFDSLAVGRPVLVATENSVSNWVKEHQLGYSCSFHDPRAMKAVLEVCERERAALPAFAARCRQLFKERYDWKIMERRMLDRYAAFARPAD